MAATLAANGNLVAATTNDVGFDASLFGLTACVINPAIGPGTASDKQVSQSVLQPGLERISISSVSATNAMPDGTLYTCSYVIAAGTLAGSYPLSNTPAAADPLGMALPVTGAAGAVQVTTCNGDCDGNGMVTIGEVVKAVNLFLGQPLCDPSTPSLSCPVADANHNGTVTIGEVVQTVNRFLLNCP